MTAREQRCDPFLGTNFDAPVRILLDGNVRATKLFKALHENGFVVSWNGPVLTIKERVTS